MNRLDYGAHDSAQAVIAVFLGGVSAEREVSLGSGKAAAESLRRSFPQVDVFEVTRCAVPAGVEEESHVVFSTLHGAFGEDGGMQTLLEMRGVEFAGCDAAASSLCFNKQRTKERVRRAGVLVSPGILAGREDAPFAAAILDDLGSQVVVKPNCQGSSVGLRFVSDAAALSAALAVAGDDGCIVEQRVTGREVTVGVLDGDAMGVVEIRPRSGRFDFASKYTKGLTEYLAPAPLDRAVARLVRHQAADAFRICGCRDFARLDFIVSEKGEPVLLEINTLPGLRETSLLPMSARCVGMEFDELVRRMVAPALARHRLARAGDWSFAQPLHA